jgi:hypothetical protein
VTEGLSLSFATRLDSSAWTHESTAFGNVSIGPHGLIDLLETRLGLAALTATSAERIAQNRDRMDRVVMEGSWFRASFEADAWSTAAELLRWRDELVLVGWDGVAPAGSSKRLRALAAIEAVGGPLDPGFCDRVRAVIGALREHPRVGIASVEVVEPLALLAPVWREVLEAVAACGVSVSEGPVPADRSGAAIDPLFEENEWDAAASVVDLLGSGGGSTALIVPGDGDVLDLTLRERGLPETGVSASSRWRGALQALPLVIANAWRPHDIERLVELLQLPVGPVPRWASYRLLRALGEEAGIGGREWELALARIAAERDERIAGNAGNPLDGEAYVARLRRFLGDEVFDPVVGIPAAALVERCAWVIDSLAFRMDDDPVIAAAVGHARIFASLVEGQSAPIPRSVVERMLDSVIGAGVGAADRVEHAAPWPLLRHPGQLIDDVDTLIWWAFDGSGVESGTWWSEADRAALSGAGCHLESSQTRREREVWSWRDARARTGKRFVPVFVRRVAGEERAIHPLAHELGIEVPEERGAGAPVRAGLEPVDAVTVDPGLFPEPEYLSYTRMSTMLGCPMKWALQYHAGLRVSVADTVPVGNRLLGVLCHRIVQELYTPAGQSYTPDQAAAMARERFDALLPSMGAPLLREGMEVDRERSRAAIVRAVRDLVAAIVRLDLVVEATEERLNGTLRGVPFIGFADLILRDSAGGAFVLDLKWSYSDTYHREELKEGRALQLATYAWLLRSRGETASVQSGFFMLAQGTLVTDSALAGDDRVDAARSLKEVWDLGDATWRRSLDGLNGGTVPVTGITHLLREAADGSSYERAIKAEPDAEGILYQSPPCRFCDFAHLCGLRQLSP